MKNHIIQLLAAAAISTSIVTVVSADPDYEEFDLAYALIQKSGIDFDEASMRIAKNYPGQVFEYELEEEDDRLVHEFKIIHREEKRKYKIEMDVLTGEVHEESDKLKTSIFGKDKDLKRVKRLSQDTLTLNEAVAIVLQQLPNGSKKLLSDVELEYEQGVLYFEVDIEDENGETEWLVDAISKTLIPAFKQD